MNCGDSVITITRNNNFNDDDDKNGDGDDDRNILREILSAELSSR